jgi:hypothetical protein
VRMLRAVRGVMEIIASRFNYSCDGVQGSGSAP